MTSLISAIDPKFVISVASLLLSVCAFAFAVYQAVIGLGPYLSEERTILPLSKDHLTRIDWKLVNRGLGPAKIIRYEVLLNERPVDLSRLSEIIMAWNKAFGTVPDSGQMACKPPGYIVPKEGSITVLEVALPTPPLAEMKKLDDLDKIGSGLHLFKVVVRYESLLFGRTFTYDSSRPGQR